MGLCKCPQRKVSTLFCFKHHVNVCESCLVADHHQCIVRSYVSWLQDNDFNPNCTLCQRSLSDTDEETIRLLCYDLFHWSCLSKYFRSFPSHTAPDGYTCPTCNMCIFPAANHVSPVADQVRAKLANVDWATKLSLTISDGSSIHTEITQPSTDTEKNGFVFVNNSAHGNDIVGTSGLSHHPNRTIDPIPASTTVLVKSSDLDIDEEDKYKRRSVFTWFARWLRSRQSTHRKNPVNSNQSEGSRTRARFCTLLLVMLAFLTLLIVLYRITRGDSETYSGKNEDPQFNPMNNPFIRVDQQPIKNPF